MRRLDKYAGQWVAFRNREVVGNNQNLKELMEAMRKRGIDKEVSVFLVPRKDEGPYIL